MKEEKNGKRSSDGSDPVAKENSKETNARPTFPDVMGPYPTEGTAQVSVPRPDADPKDDSEGKKR
jgi:hypothetical protein